jgi:hypothetical protein
MSELYVVDLPLPDQGYRLTANRIERFHEDRGLKLNRHRVRVHNGKFFVRFCFVSRMDALEFQALFAERALTEGAQSLALSLSRRALADDPLDARSGNHAGVNPLPSP